MKVIAALPGAADVKMIPRAGLPSLNIEIDRSAVARYGINAADVLDTIETIGGTSSARWLRATRAICSRCASRNRPQQLDHLDDIKVAAPDGTLIPLAQLAHFTLTEGPVSIWRENLTPPGDRRGQRARHRSGQLCFRGETAIANSSSCPTAGGWNGAGSTKICSAPRTA